MNIYLKKWRGYILFSFRYNLILSTDIDKRINSLKWHWVDHRVRRTNGPLDQRDVTPIVWYEKKYTLKYIMKRKLMNSTQQSVFDCTLGGYWIVT